MAASEFSIPWRPNFSAHFVTSQRLYLSELHAFLRQQVVLKRLDRVSEPAAALIDSITFNKVFSFNTHLRSRLANDHSRWIAPKLPEWHHFQRIFKNFCVRRTQSGNLLTLSVIWVLLNVPKASDNERSLGQHSLLSSVSIRVSCDEDVGFFLTRICDKRSSQCARVFSDVSHQRPHSRPNSGSRE